MNDERYNVLRSRMISFPLLTISTACMSPFKPLNKPPRNAPFTSQFSFHPSKPSTMATGAHALAADEVTEVVSAMRCVISLELVRVSNDKFSILS